MASTSIFSTTTIESSSPCTSPINQQKQQATVPGFTQTPQVSALNLLAEDPFSTNTSKVLFEAIDELRKHEVGQDLDLPQLVIVGKQSAGKSSLLQSLTDIPFPVGDGLCTKFATRIVSKRTPPGSRSRVQAFIEPGDVNPFGQIENTKGAKDFSWAEEALTPETFSDLIEQAEEVMGLGDGSGPLAKHFSSMVLKLEISGPERSHFGILDIPGIYGNPRDNTRQAELEMTGVEKMAISYMQKKENIIICVADALDDINNQTVFKLAGEHVDGSRVVGVWTKCDITHRPDMVVKIVNAGEGIPGKLIHWYVVQNRDMKASPSINRIYQEASTFSKYPWTDIPEQQRGTSMLKTHLANLLSKRIRESFPRMQDTVTRLLAEESAKRETFGDPRAHHQERQAYLLGIAKEFQELSNKTLRSPEELVGFDDMKLRGFTTTQTESFADQMQKSGHRYDFLKIGQPVETQDDDDPFVQHPSIQTDLAVHHPLPPTPHSSSSKSRSHDYRQKLFTSEASSQPHMQTPTPPQTHVYPLYAEIRNQVRTNRGEELSGMLNPAVLKPLWRIQTAKWQPIGETHIEIIVAMTHKVCTKIFDVVCKKYAVTQRAKEKFESTLLYFETTAKSAAMRALHDECARNATTALQTTNPKFQESVAQARYDRFEAALTRFQAAYPPQQLVQTLLGDSNPQLHAAAINECGAWMVINGKDKACLKALFNELHQSGTRSQNVEDEIHDILKAYYEVSLQSYVDYVSRHIIEPFLNSPTGPLFGLSTEYILKLTEEEVEELGGEDQSLIESREMSEKKIKRLEEASKIAAVAWRKTRDMDG